MKKLLLLIPILSLIFLLILIYKNQTTTPQKSSAASKETALPSSNKTETIKIGEFTFSWSEVNNIDNLRLIPNFDTKLTSLEVFNTHKCQFLSNAGFYATGASSAYSKENTPIGLFITDHNKLGEFQNNSLLDGILSINDMATARITRDIPNDNLKIAIQSGPIIKENASFQILRIQNDNESRRVMAAVTGENKLFFLSVFKTNSEYLGPLLTDLPNAMRNFEEKSGITFADIINLDGGSASTFRSKDMSLSEITPVGAFFCQL